MKRQPSYMSVQEHAPKSSAADLCASSVGGVQSGKTKQVPMIFISCAGVVQSIYNIQAPITRGLMPKVGVEPTCPQGALRPERSASASSATSAPCHSTPRRLSDVVGFAHEILVPRPLDRWLATRSGC